MLALYISANHGNIKRETTGCFFGGECELYVWETHRVRSACRCWLCKMFWALISTFQVQKRGEKTANPPRMALLIQHMPMTEADSFTFMISRRIPVYNQPLSSRWRQWTEALVHTHTHISIINNSKNADSSKFLSRTKRKQIVVTVITYTRLARGNGYLFGKRSPTNDKRWMGRDLPHSSSSSSRKLSNADTIWNVWYQRLWHQPTFPGAFRRKAGAPSVSHAALISAGIRKKKRNHLHQQQWRDHL